MYYNIKINLFILDRLHFTMLFYIFLMYNLKYCLHVAAFYKDFASKFPIIFSFMHLT
jgi:hypothetical protein